LLQCLKNSLGCLAGHAWNSSKFFNRGGLDLFQATKMFQEAHSAPFSDAGDLFQDRPATGHQAALAMIGYDRPVGLIPDPLEKQKHICILFKI
jgi:hypothetical protein